ncbi:MAG: HAD family hydrolase [Granulosicoccus sp.]
MTMLKNKTYWLFDMDGTLTIAMHDFDAMRAELKLPVGMPILEALAAMDPADASVKYRELDEMELRMAAEATPQDGSVELLEHLSSAGAQLGIVTRNGREIADVTLKACGLDRFFDEQSIISRDCCTAKPDPAGVNLLLSRWNGEASNAVMVGDFVFDLQAGHSAGTATVHMDVSGEFAWPEITDVSVHSLRELLDHIV